ncbi:MAG: aminotransferase class IV [Planctomycetota bacterium]|nr:aminotransferase class IV [Planctomycetota bacterium]
MEPEKKRIGYLNGQWMPHTEMSIGIDDTGFRQSITAVERLRTYRGRIFALDAHLRRWSWTISKLAIDNLPDPESIASLLMELISKNSELIEQEGDIGLTMFATPGEPGKHKPTLGLHINFLNHQRIEKHRHEGQPLIVTDVQQPATTCWPRSIKTRSRVHYYLADRFAAEHRPGSLGILLDQDGSITETSTSNVAIVSNGEIYSPPGDRVLSGVTQLMIEIIADDLGVPWFKRPVHLENLMQANEVLLMGTDGGLWFGNSVSNQHINQGESGPIYRKLCSEFDSMTGFG